MPSTESQIESPLKPAVFHILLALSEKAQHGLGMVRDGLVSEIPAPAEDEDPRRKFHQITEAGRVVLEAEAVRYQRIVEVAKERQVLREAL